VIEPQTLAFDSDGRLYASDCTAAHVYRFDPAGPTVVAGAGVVGIQGDGVPASEALLRCPFGLAFDAAGNLFVADGPDLRVRMVDRAGVITTAAGTGTSGHSGDGGPATEAALDAPLNVATDEADNLYIADRDSGYIRKVDANGIITTIAGNGSSAFAGDGAQATEASLDDPHGMAIDAAGNVFIADSTNNRVRRIDPHGIITTVAGTGALVSSGDAGPAPEAGLIDPQGVLLDGAGNLYIAETGAHRIRRIDANGIITTFAGTGQPGSSGDGGPATTAQLNDPLGMVIDSLGNIYVADRGNHRIRVVDAAGIIATFYGAS